jgi:hypothetical protein
VFRNGTAALMARVVTAAGEPINQASVDLAEYSIFERNLDDPNDLTAVAGHENVALDVETVVFDEPVDDEAWTVDEEGYNFRHEIDATLDEPFPKAGAVYQVRYELTPVTGQKVVFRFQVRCI